MAYLFLVSLLTMRIALCVRYHQQVFRLVWINESTNGIYVGVLGAKQDNHVSYHQDGTRHVKLGSEYRNRFSETPITSHKDVKQLYHFSLPITKDLFNSKTTYTGDEKTESLVLLDERLLYDKDTLALDVWLLVKKYRPNDAMRSGKGRIYVFRERRSCPRQEKKIALLLAPFYTAVHRLLCDQRIGASLGEDKLMVLFL
jgi:hypothetical protein